MESCHVSKVNVPHDDRVVVPNGMVPHGLVGSTIEPYPQCLRRAGKHIGQPLHGGD